MMRISFFTCLLLTVFKSYAQAAPVKILLNTFVEEEKGKKMQSIVAVFKYHGQPFEDPMNIGMDNKKSKQPFYAKMPDMTGVFDTSYAYIYFGALDNRKDLAGYTLMVIGNNQRSYKPALLWIDRNHNLDLSDDGPPDTFSNTMVQKDITLYHPEIKNASYTVNISRFSTSYNSKYVGMLDDYYNAYSGNKKFAGTLFSFKEGRINTIAGDYKIGNDSFRIGIKDVNCNGLYNDAGTDYILIGDYKTDLLPDAPIEIHSKINKTWFERNGKRYTILHIDMVGAFIQIEEDVHAKLQNTLVVGNKLKKFRFETTDKEKKSICTKKYKKKPMFLYVWRFEQPGFSEDTAILRIIARDYSDRIQLVTLNYGETPRELKTFKRVNAINWSIGQSTQKINDLLYIEKLPFGILTIKRLRIKEVKISPADLLLLLQNNLI